MDKEAVQRYCKVTLSFVTLIGVLTVIAIIQNHFWFASHKCLEDRTGIILDSAVACMTLLLFLVSILGTILAIKVRNKKILILFVMSFFYAIIIFLVMDFFVYYLKNCPTSMHVS